MLSAVGFVLKVGAARCDIDLSLYEFHSVRMDIVSAEFNDLHLRTNRE